MFFCHLQGWAIGGIVGIDDDRTVNIPPSSLFLSASLQVRLCACTICARVTLISSTIQSEFALLSLVWDTMYTRTFFDQNKLPSTAVVEIIFE